MKRFTIEIDVDDDQADTVMVAQFADCLKDAMRAVEQYVFAKIALTVNVPIPPLLNIVDGNAGAWSIRETDVKRFRHLKRGRQYDVIGSVLLQSETPVTDDARLILYHDRALGTYYARLPSEFYQSGRFEVING